LAQVIRFGPIVEALRGEPGARTRRSGDTSSAAEARMPCRRRGRGTPRSAGGEGVKEARRSFWTGSMMTIATGGPGPGVVDGGPRGRRRRKAGVNFLLRSRPGRGWKRFVLGDVAGTVRDERLRGCAGLGAGRLIEVGTVPSWCRGRRSAGRSPFQRPSRGRRGLAGELPGGLRRASSRRDEGRPVEVVAGVKACRARGQLDFSRRGVATSHG